MKTRLSSTEPPAPGGFVNATFAEVVEDGVRKVAVHVPISASGGNSHWWGRFVLAGLVTPSEDVLVNRYRVVLEPEQSIVLLRCATTAKIEPTADDFEADVLVSSDDGATWDSIFSGDRALIVAGDFKGDTTTFAIGTLYPDDLLRVDVLTNVDASGVEIVLHGLVFAGSPVSPPDESPPDESSPLDGFWSIGAFEE